MSRANSERDRRGWGGALVASTAAHALAIATVVALARPAPRAPPTTAEPPPGAAVEIELSGPAEPPPGASGAPPPAARPRPPPPARPPREARPGAAARHQAERSAGRPAAPGTEGARSAPRGDVDLSLRRDPTAGEPGGAETGPRSLLDPPEPRAPAAPPARGVPRVQDRPGFVARVDLDGAVHFHDKPPRDANDALMRLFGMDPYSYEKRRFAEATRAARQRMGDEARAAWEAEAFMRLPSALERLWQDRRLPASARRRALFELWDECLEAPADPPVGDGDPTAAGAARARRLILQMIRARLPPGSPDAYPPEEIDALNRRRQSRERFAPYGPPPP